MNTSETLKIALLHKKTVLVKKRHFYVKKLLFYKLAGCKNTAFLCKQEDARRRLRGMCCCKKELPLC